MSSQAAQIFSGNTPPFVVDNTPTFWISSSWEDLHVSPSEADRIPVIKMATELSEPSVWYNNGYYWMLHSGGTGTEIRLSASLDWKGPWINSGTVTDTAGNTITLGVIAALNLKGSHGFHFVDGSTLYYFYANGTTKNFMYATSSLSRPDQLAEVGTCFNTATETGRTISTPGNACVVKSPWDNKYYLFFEVTTTTTTGWQTGVAVGTSPTSFAYLDFPITDTWPARRFAGTSVISSIPDYISSTPDNQFQAWNNMNTSSGYTIDFEGEYAYLLYHAGTSYNTLPTVGFKARSHKSAFPFKWEILNNGFPFLERAHPLEVDQVADLTFVNTPGGTKVLFYSAYANNAITAYVMATELRPALKQWNGKSWDTVSSFNSGFVRETYLTQARASTSAAGVLQHMDDLIIDTAGGAVTIQAPGACAGARFRVSNAGTLNNVTVSLTGTDAFYSAGHGTVSPGQVANFVCKVQGFWSRVA